MTTFFSATATGNSVTISGVPAGDRELVIDMAGVSHNNPTNAALRIEISPDGVVWSPVATVSMFGKALLYTARYIFNGYGESLGDGLRLQPNGAAADMNVPIGDFGWSCPGGIGAVRLSWSAGNFDAGTITASVR